MKIARVTVDPLRVPLRKPFVTALRTVSTLENLMVTLHTNTGLCGYGEAPVAPAVTGETAASLTEAIQKYITPAIIGWDIRDLQAVSQQIQTALYGNSTAKSAVECALHDAWARSFQAPLYHLLGGHSRLPDNDITISASTVAEMTADCLNALGEGHVHLKIKLGKKPEGDEGLLNTLWRILRERWPLIPVRFRVDANQGWTAAAAIRIIHTWENNGLPIDWVEQPVPAWDINGLAKVTAQSNTPIMADESVFSLHDAARVIESHAADRVNIKLAKAGGIQNALKIANLCEAYGIPCMAGCMLESRLGVTAMAHVAASHANFAYIDLDGPLLCSDDPFTGGAVMNGTHIRLSNEEGFGIRPEVKAI